MSPGRTRFLNLLQNLVDQFQTVRKYYAGSLKTRKSALKQKVMERTGVYAGFYAHPNTVDLTYGQAMEMLQDGEVEGPTRDPHKMKPQS